MWFCMDIENNIRIFKWMTPTHNDIAVVNKMRVFIQWLEQFKNGILIKICWICFKQIFKFKFQMYQIGYLLMECLILDRLSYEMSPISYEIFSWDIQLSCKWNKSLSKAFWKFSVISWFKMAKTYLTGFLLENVFVDVS